jgi:uncharacterized protein (DUF885 family)
MPAATAKDRENRAARLRALPAYVDQHIELWREQLATGAAAPIAVVDAVRRQLAAQQEQMRIAAGGDAVDEPFIAAWQRMDAFLRDQYRPVALEARPGR